MKVGFYTLGCKLNQCETEAIADAFQTAGYETVTVAEPADLYIVNTCTVTTKSEQKARRLIRNLLEKSPEASVIVTGCYAQMEPEKITSLGERVQVVSGDLKDRLLELPIRMRKEEDKRDLFRIEEPPTDLEIGARFRFHPSRYSFHTRAFMKVQDGCDNHCSYCRVCLARGPSVSLPLDTAMDRFIQLSREGYREIVLTGVNLSQYNSGKSELKDLIERFLSLSADVRIRLSSLEPEAITPSLVEFLAHPQVCPHFHLPIQSGSDPVLKRMHRRYTRTMVQEAILALRSIKKEPFIAADLIVGFPGETEEDHEHTCKLVEECNLSDLHVFPYSPRPGTEAYSYRPRVPERIARSRAADLRKLALVNYSSYVSSQYGESRSVLIEGGSQQEGWFGTTENYLPEQILPPASPHFHPPKIGEIIPTLIHEIRENKLIGIIK
jgi:threonylcarbamoyladenosine tRNA methylthiotransferase MtaB